jgi:hypothetical protein
MKQTSIEWLIEEILCEVDNDLDNKKEYVNAFVSGTDLSKYVNKAKEMHKEEMASNCSQLEISDEEIEKAKESAWSDYEYQEGNLYSTTFKGGWDLAIKWYREQLKK